MKEILAKLAKLAYDELLKRLITPAGGIGAVEELGTGYSVEEDRMGDIAKLDALCEEAVSNSAWIAHDITGDGKAETFCNRAAAFIAQGMGYFGIPTTILANQMLAVLAADPGWREDTIERAHAHAMRGGLAFLIVEAHPHGHISAIAPRPMEPSGSWGCPVPLVAHVGGGKTPNGVVRASQAFLASQRMGLRAFTFGETA